MLLDDIVEFDKWRGRGYLETPTSRLCGDSRLDGEDRWSIKLYKPLPSQELAVSASMITKEYGYPLSQELMDFYRSYNGLCLFSATLALVGLEPQSDFEVDYEQDYYPYMMTLCKFENAYYQLPPSYLQIGYLTLEGHKSGKIYVDLANCDRGYLLVSTDDRKLKVNSRKMLTPGEHKLLKTWRTLTDMVSDIYRQLVANYNEKGIRITVEEAPPGSDPNTSMFVIKK